MGSCLSRNEVHPKFEEDKDYLGQRGYSRSLKSEDGTDLFAYFWPANPDIPLKAIIQLAHGSAAYTCFDFLKFQSPGLPNLYAGSWVEAFNQAGFSVCGLDHQGYGRSKGVRPDKKFQTHVDNLLLLSDDLTENGGAAFPKETPHFLVGHDMGGLAATLACLKQPNRFAGLVLLSPIIALEPTAKRSSSLRLGLKSRPKSEDGDVSSTSEQPVPWIMDAWAADPFVYDGGQRSGRFVEELLSATGRLAAEGGMEGLQLPLLVFQSERDTYVDPEGAKKLNERAASSNKTLRLLSQQWHVLTKEDGWEAVLAETKAWILAHATNSGALTRGLDGASSCEANQERGLRIGETLGAAVEKGGKEDAERNGGGGGRPDDSGTTAAAAAAAVGAAEAPEASLAATEAVNSTAAVVADAERAERNSAPVLTRSMSMLERMPEHEPLALGNAPIAATKEASPPLLTRRYSFSGRLARTFAAPGDTTPTASSANVLGPLPPLASLGQRRTLGALPPELATYNVRGRLPPLPPLMPLLDRKPIG